MPKGDLLFTASELAELYRCQMECLDRSDDEFVDETRLGAETEALWAEWNLLLRNRDGFKPEYDDESAPSALNICQFEVSMGRYPPPWALRALLETIEGYFDMSKYLVERKSEKYVPVQPSEIVRLEEYLVDGALPGQSAISHLRYETKTYGLFCMTVSAYRFESSSPHTLESSVSDFLNRLKSEVDTASFIRGLREWSKRSDWNNRRYRDMREKLDHLKQMKSMD